MDLFCEYLVKKKSVSDNLKRAALIAACAAVCFGIVYVSLFVNRTFLSAMPILIAAAIYGTVIYGRNFSVEYEYIFTNGVLDIDIIKGRARRAKLISVPCRKIEDLRPVSKKRASENKIIDAVYDEKRPGKYVVTFTDRGQKTELYFQPPEKLLLNMKKYNPRAIHIE